MRRISLLIAAFFCFNSFVAAQAPTNLEAAKSELSALKRAIIAEALQLDQKQGEVFWPLYQGYEAELKIMQARELGLLSNFLRNRDLISDAQALQLINESSRLNQERFQARMMFLNRAMKILPGRLALRLYQIENKIDAAVRYKITEQIPLIRPDQLKQLEDQALTPADPMGAPKSTLPPKSKDETRAGTSTSAVKKTSPR